MLEALSKGLTQKMLHGTLAELRAADGDERDAAGADRVASVPARQRRSRRRQALATRSRRAAAVAPPALCPLDRSRLR